MYSVHYKILAKKYFQLLTTRHKIILLEYFYYIKHFFVKNYYNSHYINIKKKISKKTCHIAEKMVIFQTQFSLHFSDVKTCLVFLALTLFLSLNVDIKLKELFDIWTCYFIFSPLKILSQNITWGRIITQICFLGLYL